MEQHIANIINHCVTTGKERLELASLNTKQVGTALREVFPLQAALGLDLSLRSITCRAEHAPRTFAVTCFTSLSCRELAAPSGVQLPLSDLFLSTAVGPGPQGRARGVTGIFSAVRGCAKQV